MTGQQSKHRRRERRHHAAAAEAAWCAFECAWERPHGRDRERIRLRSGVESPPQLWWQHHHAAHLTR